MKKIVKLVALGTVMTSSVLYGASVAACAGCHGQHFENAAMGKSKIVKDMSSKEIVDALKGYKNGTYGDTMKAMMVSQVKNLSDADIDAMASLIKADAGTVTEKATVNAAAAAVAAAGGTYIDLNENASDETRIEMEDLGNRKTVSEEALGLRKTDLYTEEKASGVKTDYERPSPGASTKFERAYKDAPPMIPHSLEGLLPITKESNQCLGCHLPEVAPSVGATPIPASHFTNYRPVTAMNDGYVVQDGEVMGYDIQNTSDIKLAKARKTDTIYQGRFNCTQCHAKQSKSETNVANTFTPDYRGEDNKEHSNLADVINEGVE